LLLFKGELILDIGVMAPQRTWVSFSEEMQQHPKIWLTMDKWKKGSREMGIDCI